MAKENDEAVRGLNALRDAAYENAKAHGFHEVKRTVGDAIMLIVTEAGEAFEAYREGAPVNEMRYECKHPKGDCGEDRSRRCPDERGVLDSNHGSLHKPVGVPSEIADIIIRCLDFSGEHGIDIESAVLEKMAFNKSRPFRHGNKAL
jgi:NTP pyrophosphatase (non-canonical NTP hydrolase)